MKIKMTNAEAAQRLKSLRELESLETGLPVVAGYRIAQTVHSLTAAIAPCEDMQGKIFKKYAEDGKSLTREDNPTAFDACVAELKELDELEVSIDIQQIPLSMIESLNLPMKAMFALDFVLNGGE